MYQVDYFCHRKDTPTKKKRKRKIWQKFNKNSQALGIFCMVLHLHHSSKYCVNDNRELQWEQERKRRRERERMCVCVECKKKKWFSSPKRRFTFATKVLLEKSLATFRQWRTIYRVAPFFSLSIRMWALLLYFFFFFFILLQRIQLKHT